MILNNPLDNKQAEPGSVRFAGLVWFKKTSYLFGRHAGAVVFEGNTQLAVIAEESDRQNAPISHGLQGVFDNIKECLLDLIPIN